MADNFQKIYKKLIQQYNAKDWDKEQKSYGIGQHQSQIYDFKQTEKGQEIEQIIQQSFQYKLRQYKQKYPQFRNVSLEFDFDSLNQLEYARIKNPGQDNPIIVINTYSIYEQILVGSSIDLLLDWHDEVNCTIAHQLAHIRVFKKYGYNINSSVEELHNNIFDKQFYDLSGKHLSEIPEQAYMWPNS